MFAVYPGLEHSDEDSDIDIEEGDMTQHVGTLVYEHVDWLSESNGGYHRVSFRVSSSMNEARTWHLSNSILQHIPAKLICTDWLL